MITNDYRVVTPAYGRDYTSQQAATNAFLNGYDFMLQPENCLCSVRDFATGIMVSVRYAKLKKVIPVKVTHDKALPELNLTKISKK